MFGLRRTDSRLGVVIVTGSCCMPGLAPLEEKVRQIVEQAVAETGVAVQIKMMPATTAYFGGVSNEIIARLMSDYNRSGKVGLPMVLINGQVVSQGAPDVDRIKAVLLEYAGKED